MMLGSYNVNIPENFKLLYDLECKTLILLYIINVIFYI